ncbi:MAG: CPBP family intramembrane metalloprotease [Spirochaetaceae bacterium]|nr:MAG: CPBP family intramembrane metalloprotease [Spirochaetaceae bacterium]
MSDMNNISHDTSNNTATKHFVEFMIVAGTFMLPSLFMAAGADPEAVMRLEYQLLSVLVGIPQIAFLWLFLQRSGGGRLAAAGWVPVSSSMLKPALRTAVVLFVVMGAAALLSMQLLGGIPGAPGPGSVGPGAAGSTGAGAAAGAPAGAPAGGLPIPLIALLLFVSTMVNSYREELLYRGYAVSTLRAAGAGRATAASVAIVLFAVVHLYQGVYGLIGAAAGGIVLTVSFLRRGEIHSLAWAHAAYNFILLMTRVVAPGFLQ